MTTTLLRSPIKDAIDDACMRTSPNSPARNKALRSIRWVLGAPTGYAALSPFGRCYVALDIATAQVFTGLDNEELKARFWSAQLGVECIATLLP